MALKIYLVWLILKLVLIDRWEFKWIKIGSIHINLNDLSFKFINAFLQMLFKWLKGISVIINLRLIRIL